MKGIVRDLALGQLRHDGGHWRRSVRRLRSCARSIGDRQWRAHYRAAAAQILRWRLEALKRRARALKNPLPKLPKRAAAVIRRELMRHIGDGKAQRVALDLAYKYARRKGLVE